MMAIITGRMMSRFCETKERICATTPNALAAMLAMPAMAPISTSMPACISGLLMIAEICSSTG